MDESGVATFFRSAIEGAALGLEVFAVTVILIAIAFGTTRFLIRLNSHVPDAFQTYKVQLAKALLLGLEFLVAADIVRTVALKASLSNVAVLGALVVVRTFLSWSLIMEMEGRWPWQAALVPAHPSTREDDYGSSGSTRKRYDE